MLTDKCHLFTSLAIFVIVLINCWLPMAHASSQELELSAPAPTQVFDLSAFTPLTKPLGLDPAKVSLGRELFSDPIFSDDGTIACASCHQLNNGGTDGLKTAVGINQQQGEFNTPTIFNVSLNFRQTWTGKFLTLNEQIDAPLDNKLEMAIEWPVLITRLHARPDYVAKFKKIYAGEISQQTIKDALTEFEKSLITTGSPFDCYLMGHSNALSPLQIEGLSYFLNYGCVSCHQGINIGGNMFQRFGVLGNYFEDSGKVNSVDLGRFNLTHRERDKFVFKVPSLRNVALTKPYFHNGSVSSLKHAVMVMGKYQLGRKLTGHEIEALTAFLHSFSGKNPENINRPEDSNATICLSP